MKKETALTELRRLNKLQMKYFGFTIEEFLEMDKIQLEPSEVEALAHDSEVYFKNNFKRVINKLIALQTSKLAEMADSEVLLAFMRGAIAGTIAVKQWFEEQEVLASGKRTRVVDEEILPPQL